MFRRERQFNIITGETSHQLITQRSRSCASQLQNYRKFQQLNTKPLKLGTAKDKKQFQYSYFDTPNAVGLPKIQASKQIKQMKKSISFQNNSMLNYVSTGYNILNHTNQIETSKVANKKMFNEKMPQVFKKSPLTQHLHRARLYAPNYHQNYQQRTNEFQFKRKPGLCASICQIQKTYGQGKYFRKFK